MSEADRRNHYAQFNTMCDAIYDGLAEFMPSHYLECEEGAELAGNDVNLHSLHKVTATLGRDKAFKNNVYDKAMLIILDGSGTLTYEPLDHVEHTELYCYWKKRTMFRWFIVVDVRGTILFVSSVYSGKIDDTTVLEDSFFYR